MLDAFEAGYMQRALLEVLLLSVPGGLLGAWIVLRRLAFATHAVGTAAFPGLVVAEAWSVAPQLTALGTAVGAAGGIERLARTRRLETDAATGLVLVGALAAGVLLASDVYESSARVDRLLFGSLLGLSDLDIALTAAVAVGAVAVDAAGRRSWLAAGFDAGSARALGVRPGIADRLLLVAVAVAVVVSLDAVGALLVAAVFVLPAATARLLTRSVRSLQLTAVGLAAGEGVVALVLARELDVGPGAALAVVGGVVFAAVAVARRAW